MICHARPCTTPSPKTLMYSDKTVGCRSFGPGEQDLCHGAGTGDMERETGSAFQSNDERVSDWHRTTRR
mgnify:CR=1 FL=1